MDCRTKTILSVAVTVLLSMLLPAGAAAQGVIKRDANKTGSTTSSPVKNAHAKSPQQLYDEGMAFYEANNYEKAYPLLSRAAGQGHARAQYEVGFMHFHGLGVRHDWVAGVKLYLKSVEQDEDIAEWRVTINRFLYGVGTVSHLIEGWKDCYEQAQRGDATAQWLIGFMGEYDSNMPKEPNGSLYWFRKSADQGNAYAQFDLGHHYYNGNGVPQDINIAKELIEKAASQGNREAKAFLKEHFGDGKS